MKVFIWAIVYIARAMVIFSKISKIVVHHVTVSALTFFAYVRKILSLSSLLIHRIV